MECDLTVISKLKEEEIIKAIGRLEKIGNTSDQFRVHINSIKDTIFNYRLTMGTNNIDVTNQDFLTEFQLLEEVGNKIKDMRFDIIIRYAGGLEYKK